MPPLFHPLIRARVWAGLGTSIGPLKRLLLRQSVCKGIEGFVPRLQGHCNMAIGIALIIGFRTPPNFNLPYFAVSHTTFLAERYADVPLER